MKYFCITIALIWTLLLGTLTFTEVQRLEVETMELKLHAVDILKKPIVTEAEPKLELL